MKWGRNMCTGYSAGQRKEVISWFEWECRVFLEKFVLGEAVCLEICGWNGHSRKLQRLQGRRDGLLGNTKCSVLGMLRGDTSSKCLVNHGGLVCHVPVSWGLEWSTLTQKSSKYSLLWKALRVHSVQESSGWKKSWVHLFKPPRLLMANMLWFMSMMCFLSQIGNFQIAIT